MTRKRTPIPNRWILAGSAVVAATVPFLLGAGADDPAQLAENRRRIADMSAHERAELKEKYGEFRALSEAERERYRRLHSELEGNAQFRQMLSEYQNWLRTLTPYQRLELRNAGDWSRRLEVVRQLREEQKTEQERRRDEERGRRPTWRPMVWLARDPRFHRALPKLEKDDLEAVVQILRDTVPDRQQLDQSVQGASDPVRYVRILTAALKNAIDQSDSSPSSLDWPDRRLMDRILGAISDKTDKARIEQLLARNEVWNAADPEGKRLLLAIVMYGVDSLWWHEAWNTEVQQQEISRILRDLPEELRTEIQFKSTPERKRSIQFQYVIGRRREFWNQDAQKLVTLFEEMWTPPPGLDLGPGGRGFSGRRGRPGDGRPDDGPRPPLNERRE